MDSKLLNEFLKLNDIEKEQLEDQKFHSDFGQKSIMGQQANYKIPVFTDDFFKNQDLYISKHNRFADYPKHTHTFLEMNYMLSGNATEYIGENKIELHQGDILILDVGTTHSIKALGKNDIMINIIFRNNIDFSLENIRNLGQNTNIISEFLLANEQFSKYLIYRNNQTEDQVQVIVQEIIKEYFHPKQFSKSLIDSYLRSFIILLSRNTSLSSSTTIKKKVPNLVLLMLKQISTNPQNCSLNEIAKQTNYNRSYLGSLFKKETGRSFSDALTEQRLLDAYNYLLSSAMPISDIIERVGISNKTFFYRKFKEKFHKTPNDLRKN